MTATTQDFEVIAGDNSQPVFTVLAANGNPISVSEAADIVWSAQRSRTDNPVLVKKLSTGGISFFTDGTDGRFQVLLVPADTATLPGGFYQHTVYVTDGAGNISTVALGRMQVGQTPSWSYSGNPGTSLKDEARFVLGDTDEAFPLIFDEEISWALTARGNVWGAVALCARALAAKFSRLVNMAIDGVSSQNAGKAVAFEKLAIVYEDKEAIYNAVPYAGGISVADMWANLGNNDSVPAIFRYGMFDNPPNAGVTPPTAAGRDVNDPQLFDGELN